RHERQGAGDDEQAVGGLSNRHAELLSTFPDARMLQLRQPEQVAKCLRHWRGESHPLARARMIEGENLGVQPQPGDRIDRAAVEAIAYDRVSGFGEVRAELVSAARPPRD